MINIEIFVKLDLKNRYCIGWDEDIFPLDNDIIMHICGIDKPSMEKIYFEYNAKSYIDTVGEDVIYFDHEYEINKFLEWIESRLLARKLRGEF